MGIATINLHKRKMGARKTLIALLILQVLFAIGISTIDVLINLGAAAMPFDGYYFIWGFFLLSMLLLAYLMSNK